jgi:hypothetical protein
MTLEEAQRLCDEECLAYGQAFLTMMEAERTVARSQQLLQEAREATQVREMYYLLARNAYLQLKLGKTIVTP